MAESIARTVRAENISLWSKVMMIYTNIESYVVHLKLKECYMSITPQFLERVE